MILSMGKQDLILKLIVPTVEDVVCTVADMADPSNASGRCYETAYTIVRSDYLSDCEVVVLGPQNGNVDDWWHAAVYVPNELTGSGTVHDYTARQFDPNLPFPYVTDFDTWVDVIESKAGVGTVVVLY